MSSGSESVADLYRREVGRMFTLPPGDPYAYAPDLELRERFGELARWLTDEVPACPELWRAVQDLQGSMLLCAEAIKANLRSMAPKSSAFPSLWPERNVP